MTALTRAVSAVAAVLVLAGCASAAAGPVDGSASSPPSAGAASTTATPPVPVLDPAPTPQLPVTVTGSDGREVTVTDVSRVVALQGPVAEIVVALGLRDRLVARDQSTTLTELDDLPVVSAGHTVNAEGLLAQRPSLVLADARVGPAGVVDQLRTAGVPVVMVPEAFRVQDMAARITAVAAALGVPDAAEGLIARIPAVPTSPAEDDAPRVAFLYLRGTAAVYLLGGEGSGADALIAAAGGIDAGRALGLGSFTPLTSESLVSAAPDVILVMSKGLESVGGVDGLLALPGVAQTPAGRDRRIVAVEDGLLLSFGPRTDAVVQSLREGIGTA